jgi:hypothetical protein
LFNCIALDDGVNNRFTRRLRELGRRLYVRVRGLDETRSVALVDAKSAPTPASWYIKLLAGRTGFLPGSLELEEEVAGTDDLIPEMDTGFFSFLGLIKPTSR